MTAAAQRAEASSGVAAASVLGIGAAALAAWAIVVGRPGWGGAAAAAAGAFLLGATVMSRRGVGAPSAAALERVAISFADRGFDAGVFGAIAWAWRAEEPVISAGALLALTLGSLSAYVGSRGRALGYHVEENPLALALRYGLVSGGLLTGWVAPGAYAAAAVAAVSTVVRTGEVAREERA